MLKEQLLNDYNTEREAHASDRQQTSLDITEANKTAINYEHNGYSVKY